MREYRWATALTAIIALTSCKPPPSDEALLRDPPEPEPTFASAPLPSPDTEGAVWVESGAGERIVYGVPGEAALMALECVRGSGAISALRITRFAPADEGAGALMALIGNGHMGRLPVDAEIVDGRSVWRGEHRADAEFWEPLAGPRALAATVPGAGRVALNPSPLPMALVRACRETNADASPD